VVVGPASGSARFHDRREGDESGWLTTTRGETTLVEPLTDVVGGETSLERVPPSTTWVGTSQTEPTDSVLAPLMGAP
jgi:hypothetical protein